MNIIFAMFQCANCGFDVHKKFVHKVEETCVGPSNKKGGKKRGDRAERLSTILPIPIGRNTVYIVLSPRWSILHYGFSTRLSCLVCD